jgi:hypothetical protein
VTDDVVVDERFAALMVALAEAFGGRLTEQRIRLYAQALGDLPLAQVELAVQRGIRESRYFPSVAELRAFVQPTGDEAALLAWSGFQRAAADVGAWASLVVEDPCAAEALEAVFGSWPEYCSLEGPAVGARRQEFVAAYRASQRKVRPAASVTLTGWCEAGWVGHLTTGGEVRRLPSVAMVRGLLGSEEER